ncbi:hypothetical protein ACFV1L_13155 [Kitasatospora sp. NPDC059646]
MCGTSQVASRRVRRELLAMRPLLAAHARRGIRGTTETAHRLAAVP